jgi:uncharacterized repeat protein (TIGR03987 family)
MPTYVITIIIYFTLALLFYTLGVLSEKQEKTLKFRHLIFFWLGLITDTLATNYVMKLEDGITVNFHTLTGFLGLVLMLIHTLWATYVLIIKKKKQIHTFHKFSFLVWLIWLIPYLTGLFFGIMK